VRKHLFCAKEKKAELLSHSQEYPFYLPTYQNQIKMVKRVLVGYGIDVDAVSGWYEYPAYQADSFATLSTE
jgi:protoporphyrinogen oxidase